MTGTVSRRELLMGASAIAFVSTAVPASAKAVPATDPFIERLIARMSIEDKAGQLSIYTDPARTDGPPLNPGLSRQSLESLKAEIAGGRMTGLFNGIGVTIGRELQRTAIEQSPHGIPLIFAGDVIHGMKTIFPGSPWRGIELRSGTRPPHRARPQRWRLVPRASCGCSHRWSTSRATNAGGALWKARARIFG